MRSMRWIQTVDNQILGFIQNHIRCRFLDRVMPVLTSLGNGGAIWLIITAVWLARAGTRRMGFLLLAVLLVCVAVGNFGIKLVAARKRPCHTDTEFELLINRPSDFSFPSCHTMSSFGAAGVMVSIYPLWGIAALALAAVIGFSRLYLYVHYPSDVVAGLVLGLLAAGFIVYFV